MAFTSMGWSLQKSAIWSNVSAVFSSSQTDCLRHKGLGGHGKFSCAPPARMEPIAIEDDVNGSLWLSTCQVLTLLYASTSGDKETKRNVDNIPRIHAVELAELRVSVTIFAVPKFMVLSILQPTFAR
jgi:hypothetical protein